MHRGFGRTALTAAAAVAALFAATATTASTAGATDAEQAAPARPAARSQAPAIDQGRSSARAAVLTVAPSTGSLQFALGSGEVIAETAGGLAQAQSSAADLGLIGSSLTAENCEGDAGALTPEQLPQVLVVDNRAGPASEEGTEAPVLIPGTSGGHKEVSATATPSSRASVTAIDADLPGVLTVDGGQAVAEAEVFPGAGREARSSVSLDIDLFGAVQLRGVHWSARHRTGGQDGAEGAFSIDALEVLGVPIPVESVEQATAAIDQALAALGLQIEMPQVVRIQEGPVDVVRVTPLRVRLADSPVGQLVVRPALQATQELRSQLFDAVTGITCQAASVLLVGEIGTGIAAGTGTLIADIGGVEASSANIVIENVFGDAGGGLLPPAAGDPTDPGSTSGGGAGTPATPARPGVGVAAPSTGGVVGGATPVAASGPFDRICESIHPKHKPACSNGAAAAVGVAGLAATAAVGVLDLRRRRRPSLTPAAPGAVS